MEKTLKILFFGKKGHWATKMCLDFLYNNNVETESYIGVRGDKFPDDVGWLEFDLLISFSSPWVIPKFLLDKSKTASLNFHPGPPEYPGIGCTNFAIYNEEKVFGVTCHHMKEKVDIGKIVKVRRFPIFDDDGVKELTDRCYHHLYTLFVDVVGGFIFDGGLPTENEEWTRSPYTRQQLNELCRLDLNMNADEMRRRVRALSFPGYPGAFIELNGIRFDANDGE